MIFKVTVAIVAIFVSCKATPILSKLTKIFDEGSYGSNSGSLLDRFEGAIDLVLPNGGSYGPDGFELIDVDKERFRPNPAIVLESDGIFDIDRGYGADEIELVEIDKKSTSAVVVETDKGGRGFDSDRLDIQVEKGGSYGSSQTLLEDIKDTLDIDITDGGSYA